MKVDDGDDGDYDDQWSCNWYSGEEAESHPPHPVPGSACISLQTSTSSDFDSNSFLTLFQT